MTNMAKLEADISLELSNVIQGSAWKTRKQKFGNKTVIPYCTFFVHFPTLPPHIATALENIFPILSCKTSQKKYGLDSILHATITELSTLESEGLILVIEGVETQVSFSLCLLLITKD